ncbi:MAG: hypothetical protein ACRDSS_02720, partial [Actinocrinis sp.]
FDAALAHAQSYTREATLTPLENRLRRIAGFPAEGDAVSAGPAPTDTVQSGTDTASAEAAKAASDG